MISLYFVFEVMFALLAALKFNQGALLAATAFSCLLGLMIANRFGQVALGFIFLAIAIMAAAGDYTMN